MPAHLPEAMLAAAVLIAGAWAASKRLAWKDVRPRGLAPLSAFGDFINLPEEARGLAAPRLKGRAGSGHVAPSAAVSGLDRTHSEGGL